MPSKHKHPMIRLHSDVADRLTVCNGAIASEALRRYYRILDESVIHLSEDEFHFLYCLFFALGFDPLETWPDSIFSKIDAGILSITSFSKTPELIKNVDIPALRAKLYNMTLVQAIALVEKIERG
jgi:hypothetical protein